MSFLSKRTCVVWPHKSTVDVYLDNKDTNPTSFELNIWQSISSVDLAPLITFFKDNHVASISVLIPDDVIVTKSFVYDAKITSVDTDEVVKLAVGTTSFDITAESINFNLIPQGDKTIIRSEFSDLPKITNLKQNIANLGVKVDIFQTVSTSVAKAISTFYQQEYFLLYTLNLNESFLILSSGESVYLTNCLKKSALNIQKLINYSKLYFNHTVEKIFLPANNPPEVSSTSKLDKTFYDPVQIANSLHLPSTLPLPVLGLLLAPKTSNITISKPMTDNLPPPTITPQNDSPKNILPIIAVFIITAAVASIAIWFVLNRNQPDGLTTPSGQQEPTPIITEAPTVAPTPTSPPIDKKLKLQVLNATDINGQAATLKAILIELGFENVTVGNSKEKVTGNEIRFKPSLLAVETYFQPQLVTRFPAKYSSALKETSTYDVVFVIGSDLSKPTAATSTSPTESTSTPTIKTSPSPSPTLAP